MSNLIVGNKYVPYSKSTWGSLNDSVVWKEAQKMKQPYLYYTGFNDYHTFDSTLTDTGDHFLESDVTPYEEFVLPKKYCIKHYQEVADYIIKLEKSNDGSWVEDLDMYSHFPPVSQDGYSKYCFYKKIEIGYTEITLEQFKTYVLKQDTMQKLTGYKVLKSFPSLEGIYQIGEILTLSNSIFAKAGNFPEFLEPVYEAKFKVGDWVKWTLNKTLVAQLIRKSEDKDCWVLNEISHNSCHKNYLILATPQEIEDAQTVTIAGYKAEFLKNGVKFGCQTFTKNTLEVLILLKSTKEIDFKCSVNDSSISLEILKKLYAKLN